MRQQATHGHGSRPLTILEASGTAAQQLRHAPRHMPAKLPSYFLNYPCFLLHCQPPSTSIKQRLHCHPVGDLQPPPPPTHTHTSCLEQQDPHWPVTCQTASASASSAGHAWPDLEHLHLKQQRLPAVHLKLALGGKGGHLGLLLRQLVAHLQWAGPGLW
jgi:hypothetical protein